MENWLRWVSRVGTTTRPLYACQQRIKQLFQNVTGHGCRGFRRSQVLAGGILDSTRGLSTPADAREKIASIQRSLIQVSISGVVFPQVSGKEIKWRSPVKLFSLLKIPAMVLGFGAVVVFAPTCKAQSEVSPDHFDGTDPWEIAARKPVTPRTKAAPAPASYQVRNEKAGSGAGLQLAAARDLSNPVPHNTVAVQDKRKTAVRKANKE